MHKIVQIFQMDMDAAILQHLKSQVLSDQSALLTLLKQDGFDLTLSTLSRRMKKLSIRKEQGVYRQSLPTHPLTEPISLRRVEPCLLVLKTRAGTAQALAVALDTAQLPSLAGSVAGYDTIFIAPTAPSRLASLEAEVRRYLGNQIH